MTWVFEEEKRDIVILVVERVNFLGEVWIDIQAVLKICWAGPRKRMRRKQTMNCD